MIKLGRFVELSFDEDKKELIIEDRSGGRFVVALKVRWIGQYGLAKSVGEKPKLEKIYEEE